MAGAHSIGDITERAQTALRAGCDSLLICNHSQDAITVLEKLEHAGFKNNVQRDHRLKKLFSSQKYTREELLNSAMWKKAADALKQIC